MNNLFHHTYMKINQISSKLLHYTHKFHNNNARNKCKKYYRTTQSKCQNKMLEYKPHLPKYTKRTTQRKNLDNTNSLRKPRNKEFQPPDLEIDFLIDSGAESNIINIPTWNEIKLYTQS